MNTTSFNGTDHFLPGQNVRFNVTDSVLGEETDPTTLTLTIQPPGGAQVVLASPVNVSAGVYYQDYTLPMSAPPGTWFFRWQSTGPTLPTNAENGLQQGAFIVDALNF